MVATRTARHATASDPAAELDFVERVRADPLFIAAQAVFGLKLVLTVLLFDPQAFDAFSLVKSAAAHATSLVLVVLLVGILVVHGRRVVSWSPLHLLVGALLACYALATVFAIDPQVAVFGAWRRYLGLTQMADDVVVYAAAVVLLPTARDLARLATVTLAAASVVVAYMFIQQLGLDPVVYIQRNIRPIGTFGQPDLSSAFAGLVSAVALGLAVWVRSVPLRAACGALALLSFLALLFTNVRGGIVGFAFGFVAVVALAFWGDRRPSTRVLAGIGAAAVVAVAAVLASPLRDRLGPGLFADASSQSRLDTWLIALQLIAGRPLLGLGPDNFAVAYPAARTLDSALLNAGELQNSTHNWLLQVATSAGVLGVVALLALLALAGFLALRLGRQGHPAALALPAVAAFFGQGLVTINDPGMDWIPWLCVGIIAGASGSRLVAAPQRKRAPAPLIPPRTRLIAISVVAALTLLFAGAAARDRVAASEHFAASEALQLVNRSGAIVESQLALSLDPRRAEHWSGVGAALNGSNKVAAASAAFAQAAHLEPSDATFWRNLGLMRILLDDPRGGLAALERAAQADPFDPETRDLLARITLSLGDAERASREGHLAVRLRPLEPTTYEAPTTADIRRGKPQAAEEMLRQGLTRFDLVHSLPLRILLAQVLHEEKRDEEARKEIATVLSVDPTNASALKLRDLYK
jgi:O-antigen ligase/Flp pilus assembly protein TadD